MAGGFTFDGAQSADTWAVATHHPTSTQPHISVRPATDTCRATNPAKIGSGTTNARPMRLALSSRHPIHILRAKARPPHATEYQPTGSNSSTSRT